MRTLDPENGSKMMGLLLIQDNSDKELIRLAFGSEHLLHALVATTRAPSSASKPLGEITLPVQFGTTNNYRIEHINFYVVDFNTAYHAILGRPALAKFMLYRTTHTWC